MKILILIALILTVRLSAFGQWDLNDVSFLLPLPSHPSQDRLLRMNHSARGGFLLHPGFANQLPQLTVIHTPEDLVNSLRVISVRLDPCFPLPTPQSCQRQVRLVWQPLDLDRKQNVVTGDAALHSFYELNDSEFISLLQELTKWKSRYQFSTLRKPLQVHPAWAQRGTESPALIEFQTILRRYIGMYNFRKVTGMFLRGTGNLWAFASYELQDGKLRPQPIARLNGKKSQSFVNLALPTDHFESARVAPQPQGEDLIHSLLDFPLQRNSISEAHVFDSFKSLYKMENPRYYHAENLDCVSCHITQPIKQAFYHKRPDLKLSQTWTEFQYSNPRYNLANTSTTLNDTQIVRAFGYFGKNPAISQRVIHESAEVADSLNQAAGFGRSRR